MRKFLYQVSMTQDFKMEGHQGLCHLALGANIRTFQGKTQLLVRNGLELFWADENTDVDVVFERTS